jgi:hypothetical protein
MDELPQGPQLKIAFVSSAGGHLLQLHRLQPWWEKHERLWVTFDLPDSQSLLAGERLVWAFRIRHVALPTTRSKLSIFSWSQA